MPYKVLCASQTQITRIKYAVEFTFLVWFFSELVKTTVFRLTGMHVAVQWVGSHVILPFTVISRSACRKSNHKLVDSVMVFRAMQLLEFLQLQLCNN